MGLGRATAVLLGAVVAGQFFSLWAGGVTYGVYDDLAAGVDVVERAEDADRLTNLAAMIQTPLLIAAVVVYLCWFWRVRVNGEVFEPGGHAKARGWVIGAWFVPVVNLWFPRRLMVDVWNASAPLGRTVSPALVNVWWAAWILWLLAGRVGAAMVRHADTAAELRRLTGMTMVTDAVEAVAGVLAILVVLRVTRMQNEKALAGAWTAALPVRMG
ncbi:DUF4328 domain-containing protein [Streptomyces roseirectus]|uniref:DUF4328 domain-containing protein n=1 Tax=Streptomyces roseirectus TaxID=2768066 RepID=UPI001FE640EB|nr:DUF4328 domain-containing protein [Streptomyces roseirectus]